MLVLDTNVISEVMRPRPSEAVVAWLNQQPGTNLFITSISLAEIGYGLRVLADGQRRRNLQYRFEEFVSQGFEYSIRMRLRTRSGSLGGVFLFCIKRLLVIM